MVNNAPSVYKASGVYKTAGGGGGGVDLGIPKNTVEITGITHKLFFFCGRVCTENLKVVVDLGTHTFYPNGDAANVNDYGCLYDYTAVNALSANINNISVEWGKWVVIRSSGVYSFDNGSYLTDYYSAGEWIDPFKVQKAGLRINSDGTYAGFGSSMCLAQADSSGSYYDITDGHFSSYSVSNRSMSVRLMLVKP